MIDGVRIKICGLTTLVDAEFADRAGADCLGFILYPQSPRYVSLQQYRDMAPRLPEGRKRVAVLVEPDAATVEAVLAAGFDRMQIHFQLDGAETRVALWSRQIGPERLWLVPKLPPTVEVPAWVRAAAGTVLMDTFHRDKFGGTGETGDWSKFRRHQELYPKTTWILSGGISPTNVGSALRETAATFLDVNSGVETAPGIKDHAKIRALVLAIHRARAGAGN